MHNIMAQRTLPLCLIGKLKCLYKCLYSGSCPRVVVNRKVEINTLPEVSHSKRYLQD